MVEHKTMTIFFALVFAMYISFIPLGTSTSPMQVMLPVSLAVLLLSGTVLIGIGLKEKKIENILIFMLFGLLVYILMFWFVIRYILQLY